MNGYKNKINKMNLNGLPKQLLELKKNLLKTLKNMNKLEIVELQ